MNKRKLLVATLVVAVVGIAAVLLRTDDASQPKQAEQTQPATATRARAAESLDSSSDLAPPDPSPAAIREAPRPMQAPFVPPPTDAAGIPPTQKR